METELPEPVQSREDDYGVDLEAGAMIGEYEIEKRLGQGSLGTVYAAHHPTIDRRVAIKILRRELCKDDGAVARFVREARAVNKIRHARIVEVFGYGQTEDGRGYLIMELLEGESLAARLAYDRPSLSQSCKILTGITHALEAAHAAGIVHRGIVANNVFLLDDDRVKLLDFGIATLVDPYEDGRPDAGEPVDGRSDVYSLGVVAYELLVGRLPFVGDPKHITVEPPAPTSIVPSLPHAADVLLLEMLAKNPEQRPPLARVRELLQAIRVPHRAVPRAVPVEPLPPAPRRRFLVALAATVVLMVGSYAAWRVASGEDGELPIAPAAIVEPAQGEAPFESPIEMPTLRSAETAKYQVVEKPVYIEVERPAPPPRPQPAAAPPVVIKAPAPVVARPAPLPPGPPPPIKSPPIKSPPIKSEPTTDTSAVLATPPTTKVEPATEPPVDDLDALKRPTFKRARPVP